MIRMNRMMVVFFSAFLSLLLAGTAFAGKRNLISGKGGSYKPSIAKSWNKVKDGEIEFVLDLSKEVKKGVKVTPALVKASLEKKLGKKFGCKVTEKGADKVSVTYTGAENDFLDKVAKTKIRAAKGVNLALESSVSEGGIRAAKPVRSPGAGEVKALVKKVGKGWVKAKVFESKSKTLAKGSFKVKLGDRKVAVKNAILFTPKAKGKDGVWTVDESKDVLVGK